MNNNAILSTLNNMESELVKIEVTSFHLADLTEGNVDLWILHYLINHAWEFLKEIRADFVELDDEEEE